MTTGGWELSDESPCSDLLIFFGDLASGTHTVLTLVCVGSGSFLPIDPSVGFSFNELAIRLRSHPALSGAGPLLMFAR